MLNLREIHKPTMLADALKFLQQPNTIALAGGTQLLADKRHDVRAVVDLSALGLAYIRERDGAITIGATTTLAALDESPILRALANGVIAQAAHHSASSILRNQATIVGTLIAEPDGALAVALLALDARAMIVGKETRAIAVSDLAKELDGKSLVTEITVPMTNPRTSLQTVARTPSDKPIVCVVASARIENGGARDTRIALGGVGEIATRASAAENELEGQPLNDAVIEKAARVASQDLSPRDDPSTTLRTSFRGSAEYRKEMAIVLTRRAVKELMSS
ncbi:MAG: FAD binding domain-containing protein [Anaerolineales bacterium]|nr:FAD binding domain-containing protein [Anaerolineales bacterium]